MKILLISNMYPSEKDLTYGTFVKEFVKGIQRNCDDIEIDLCVIRGRHKGFIRKTWYYIIFYTLILYKIFFTKYDIVYNHQITHTAPILRIVYPFISGKLVMNIHGGDLLTTKRISYILQKVAKPLLRKADMIVVPSMSFKRELLKRVSLLSQEKVFVSASGGIEESMFLPINSHTSNTILYVSRIDKGKGWNILLRAFARLTKDPALPNLKLVMVGYGSQIKDMKELISKLGVEESCKYIGPKPHDELKYLYNTADVFVFPTELHESLGLVGVEAMAAGCPVIGSDIGCVPEYVKNNKTGLLFESGNADDLYDKLIIYYRLSPQRISEMKMSAVEMAKKYEANNVAKSMITKLKMLCSQ